jgi:epoxyqueuosine reductase
MRSTAVKRLALECGFELAGITPAVPASDAGMFLEWAAQGMAGAMGYLTDHRAEIRTDPRKLLPSARSIICIAHNYNPGSGEAGAIARYAWGEDYHEVLKGRMLDLVNRMHAEFGEFDYKACVDTAALLERSYARLAGLGWIGRNTCLINQQHGSYVFLAELLVSLELEPDTPAPYRCGSCTRCIDACPTGAFVPGGYGTQLDSRRCISYLTIELRGNIPEEMRDATGGHVFGCDICQEVCPWNRKAAVAPEPARVPAADLGELALLSPEQFRAAFRHTPVWRTRYSGFLRNVAVAMGNARDLGFQPALTKLAESPDQVVAEHARWALDRLTANAADG